MKEQDVPEAGILEKAAVKGFLLLEKHLEKKPPAPLDWQRRKLLVDSLVVISGGVLLGGTFWLKFLKQDQEQINKQASLTASNSVAQASEINQELQQNYYNTDWQKSPDVHTLVAEARKDRDLSILEAKPIPFRAVKNNIFYQTSHGAILSINTKSLEEWLNQYKQTNPTIAFVFNDKTTSQMSISGVKNFWLELEDNWQKNVHGKTPSELNISFSSYLSSMVAVTNEYISQYGEDETIRIFSSPPETTEWQSAQKRFSWYQEQFIDSRLPFFVKVIAINPLWISQKLQSQRP